MSGQLLLHRGLYKERWLSLGTGAEWAAVPISATPRVDTAGTRLRRSCSRTVLSVKSVGC